MNKGGIQSRRSVRLRDFDYAGGGAYFVTVCAWRRECLFGDLVDGVMRLNAVGEIVRDEWLHTAELRPNVVLDEFVVMPNHFHAIVWISNIGAPGSNPPDDSPVGAHPPDGSPVGAHRRAPGSVPTHYPIVGAETRAHICAETRAHIGAETRAHIGAETRAHICAPLRRESGSLGSIMAGFKSAATKRINLLRDNAGCPVWQRNYYEHVIRGEHDLYAVRQYIADNPTRWESDPNFQRPYGGGC